MCRRRLTDEEIERVIRDTCPRMDEELSPRWLRISTTSSQVGTKLAAEVRGTDRLTEPADQRIDFAQATTSGVASTTNS